MTSVRTLDDFPMPRQLRAAAVLVPFFTDAAGHAYLVLVRRSAFGIHGGQLAFPGGKPDPTDANLQATALREAWEEIGLPAHHVTILTELPVVEVPTGFRITPFLGRIRRPAAWQPQEREIQEVLEIPLAELTPAHHTEEVWQLPGWPDARRVPFYRVGAGYPLWGASYRIVQALLPTMGQWLPA